jgi:hypothetical protein
MEIKVRMPNQGVFAVNEKLAGIVPMAIPSEQEALIDNIKEAGQKEPIVLWKGEIVDGRCRQIALAALNRPILYKELDDKLTEDEVKIYVKAVNTRRNLTIPQKIAVACKEYMNNKATKTRPQIANSWGISKTVLDNALWVYSQNPEIIETIFNGGSVKIINDKGQEVDSNKITTIYAAMKRQAEQVTENTDHGWKPDSYIKTQAGKDWYYELINRTNTVDASVLMSLAELANYKYPRTTGVIEGNDEED